MRVSLIKICGLRELPHMLAAADAGADLLGMVFVPTVRRYIAPEVARQMVQAFREAYPSPASAPGPVLVGLFADQPVEEVNRVAASVGVDRVQLCGSEGPEYWAQVRRPLLQLLHVPDAPEGDSVQRAETVAALGERISALGQAAGLALLDRRSERQPGGLGQTFDWSLARALADRGHRFLLAGGLSPENVLEAIATARPYGVDVSSGVETDEVKDVAKIRAFVQAARRALGSSTES